MKILRTIFNLLGKARKIKKILEIVIDTAEFVEKRLKEEGFLSAEEAEKIEGTIKKVEQVEASLNG